MSLCRRTESGGIYIFEMAVEEDGHYTCQICSLHPRGNDWFGRGKLRVLLHLLRHKWIERDSVRILPGLRRLWYRS